MYSYGIFSVELCNYKNLETIFSSELNESSTFRQKKYQNERETNGSTDNDSSNFVSAFASDATEPID